MTISISLFFCLFTLYIPGAQMTLVLIAKDLVLEGSTTKIENKQVPGIYIYIHIFGDLFFAHCPYFFLRQAAETAKFWRGREDDWDPVMVSLSHVKKVIPHGTFVIPFGAMLWFQHQPV